MFAIFGHRKPEMRVMSAHQPGMPILTPNILGKNHDFLSPVRICRRDFRKRGHQPKATAHVERSGCTGGLVDVEGVKPGFLMEEPGHPSIELLVAESIIQP